MTTLIFGASGQDGYYLSQFLAGKNIEVIPISRKDARIQADIADFNTVRGLVGRYKPDIIFDFAANSTTRHDVMFENHATICTGSLNILEAVRTVSPQTKVFLSGSGLQFRNTGSPIKETDPFEARDAYSICRIQSVYAARYFRTLGIKAYIGYFFNHDSPIRTERHVTKMIANAVVNISKGKETPLEIGDLSVKKEWAFAGDIVEAVWTLVQQDDVFEAVIGTGKAYSIQEYVEACFAAIRKDWRQYVTLKQGFRSEYSQLVSDPSTILSLGWTPRTDFNQLVQMMLKQ